MARAKKSTVSKTFQENPVITTPVSDGFTKAKNWYKSRAIIGVIIMAVGTMLKAFFPEMGFDLDGAVQTIMEDGTEIAQQADLAYASLVQIFGAIMSLWGSFKRKVGIKSVV